MIEYILLGALLGIIAGLVPGLHTNNIALILIAIPNFDNVLGPIILTLAMTQTFVEFIPATFLGAPSANTFEGVLPAHQLFLAGKGAEAVTLSVYGGLIGVGASVLITPLFFLFIEKHAQEIIFVTPVLLLFALILMISQESTLKKKIIAFFVCIAAASQGMLFTNQLFPLISGYFGVATLLYSLKDNVPHHAQQEATNVQHASFLPPLLGAAGGTIVALMPGIGTNTAAGMIRAFTTKTSERAYLSMIGAINTANFFFGYATLFALNKTRNGAMVVLQHTLTLTPQQLYLGIVCMIIGSGIGALSTLFLAKKAAQLFTTAIVRTVSKASIMVIVLLVAILNGPPGLLCLLFATALGVFVQTTKVKRSLCMSALIVPALFFYLFILL